MDFLTSMPYWGIVLIILLNAFIVSRLNVTIDSEDAQSHHEEDRV